MPPEEQRIPHSPLATNSRWGVSSGAMQAPGDPSSSMSSEGCQCSAATCLETSGHGVWNDADPKMQVGLMAQHLRVLATQS